MRTLFKVLSRSAFYMEDPRGESSGLHHLRIPHLIGLSFDLNDPDQYSVWRHVAVNGELVICHTCLALYGSIRLRNQAVEARPFVLTKDGTSELVTLTFIQGAFYLIEGDKDDRPCAICDAP